MKRSSTITLDQLRVGTLLIGAALVLGFGVYRLGQAANLFAKRYELIVYLPAASGLRPGGSVTLAGQMVGTVKDIEFLPVDYDTTRNLRVRVRIDRSLREQIRRDSEAQLRTMGLLGDKVLDIKPGTPRYPVLAPGDTIHVAQSADYEAMLAKASSAVDVIVALSGDLRSITKGLANGKGTLGQLLTNPAMYDQVTSAMARANMLFTGLQNPNGTVGRMLNDPALYNKLSSVVTSLDSTLVAINSSQGSFGKFLRDTALYANVLGISRGADSLVKMMYNHDGFVGKLMTDQELYDRLTKLTADLSEMLSDVRRDPRRYTRGLICVIGCKK